MTPPILDFYKGKHIFITGGTGFMGIVTVEKLLRSFPEIGSIYLLIRPKKNITIEERKKTYFNNVVFDRLKSEQNIDKFSQKLHWIEGDITIKNLGISEENIRKLQNVINLIIHGAAEIRVHLNLSLKHYVVANIRSTYDLLKIAEKCAKLTGFMFISTAYCQTKLDNFNTTECVLKSNISPLELIKMAEHMSVEDMEVNLKSAVKNWLAYYSYSKNCAENVCAEFEGRFPIAIFRPTQVGHTYAEPKPYYITKSIAFPRVLMEANRGYVIQCNPEISNHMVPVDYQINAMLAVMGKMYYDKKLKVFNCTTTHNPCTVSSAYRYYANSIPDYDSVLIPHRYRLMEMHNAPPGSLETKMRQKIKEFHDFYDKLGAICAYKNLTYENDNLDALWGQLCPEEKELLPFDVRACNWRIYYSNMVAKQYGTEVPKFEDLVSDPSKRRNLKKIFMEQFKSKY